MNWYIISGLATFILLMVDGYYKAVYAQAVQDEKDRAWIEEEIKTMRENGV